MPATSSSVGSGAAGAAAFAELRQPPLPLLRPEGQAGDPLRGRHRRRPARSRALPDPELDHLLPRRSWRLREGRHRRQKLELASVPSPRPGVGAHALSAPVQDRDHGAERHRQRPQVGCAEDVRQGLAEDPADASGCLEARRVRARHRADAGPALRLHPDDQQRDADQLVLQAAPGPGHHPVSGRDRHGCRRVERRARQEGLARGRHLAGHARGRRDDHGVERLSRAVFRHQHRVRAAGRRAVPLRLPDAGGCRQPRLHHPAGDLGRRGRLRAQPREHDRPRLPAGQRRAERPAQSRAVPGLARQALEHWRARPRPGCSRSGRSRTASRSRSRMCAPARKSGWARSWANSASRTELGG